MHKITLLGTGLIGRFYTMSLLGEHGRDEIQWYVPQVWKIRAKFAEEFNIPRYSDSIEEAVADPETDVVIVGNS